MTANNTTNCSNLSGRIARAAGATLSILVGAAVSALTGLVVGLIARANDEQIQDVHDELDDLDARVIGVEQCCRALQGLDALHAEDGARMPEPGHPARRTS